MGPLIILDKSALQGFSRNEMSKLMAHYMLVVVPILMIEIIADLKKEAVEGRMPEDDVIWLSRKLLGIDSKLSVSYKVACVESMMGNDPPPGFIMMSGGKEFTTSDGKTGVFYDEPPEYKALRNWSQGQFEEAERALADNWRKVIAAINLEEFRRTYADRLQLPRPKDFNELSANIDKLLANPDTAIQHNLLKMLMDFVDPPEKLRNAIFDRWLGLKMPEIARFSPYPHYCLRTILIFYEGVAHGLISTRATNRVDLEYFLYAHFGYILCSRDKFHRALAPYILKSQTFIEGDALKADLKWLDEEWKGLSDEQKRTRSEEYGSRPPERRESITWQMWQKYMKPWKPGSGNRASKMSKEEEASILAEMRSIMDAIDGK